MNERSEIVEIAAPDPAHKDAAAAIPVRADNRLAGGAFERGLRPAKWLKNTFLAVVEAGLTQVVKGLSLWVTFLQRQSGRPAGKRRKLITLRLLRRAVGGYERLFKITQAVQDLRLRHLRLEELFSELAQHRQQLGLEGLVGRVGQLGLHRLEDRQRAFAKAREVLAGYKHLIDLAEAELRQVEYHPAPRGAPGGDASTGREVDQ